MQGLNIRKKGLKDRMEQLFPLETHKKKGQKLKKWRKKNGEMKWCKSNPVVSWDVLCFRNIFPSIFSLLWF